jgi:hypothetical protein
LEIMVDGRLNRYALDLMQRAKLSFEMGAEIALSKIKTMDDVQFLLDRLDAEGSVNALIKGSPPCPSCPFGKERLRLVRCSRQLLFG